MLESLSTVPHVPHNEVVGVCGGKVWPMLPDGAECMHLWLAKGDMVGVQLDAAGVKALRDLLGEIEGRLERG